MYKLYSEGLLDPAAFSQDLTQLTQLGSSNPQILGSFTAGHLAMGINTQDSSVYDNFDLLMPLRGSNGYRGITKTLPSYLGGGGWAITDKCKNPEAAMRLLDELAKPENVYNIRYGIQGVHWDWADPNGKNSRGLPAVWKTLPAYNPTGTTPVNHKWGYGTQGMRADDTEGISQQIIGDLRHDFGNYYSQLNAWSFEWNETSSEGESFLPLIINLDIQTVLTATATPIKDYVKSAITEFATGSRNIETGWNGYLADLEKLGYTAYIKRFSEVYFANTKK
jgi:putative aldouronate transport system substrate-binding protein